MRPVDRPGPQPARRSRRRLWGRACALTIPLALAVLGSALASVEGARSAGPPVGAAWQPLVLHEGAKLSLERVGRPAARVLRMSDKPGRAGYVATTAKVQPAATVVARADLNLLRQRLRRGKARALVAVAGRDGTSYQAGVVRRRSGRTSWAVWIKTPAGGLVGLRAGGGVRMRSWHDLEVRTRWAGRRVRATLRLDGAAVARTPLRDLATVTGERVILGLGRPSTRLETGVLLIRSAGVTARAPTTIGGKTPSPPDGTPPAGAAPVPGDFQLLPLGASLPSDRHCAASVRRSSWEPRPENYEANHLTPGGVALPDQDDFDARWNATLKPRITGAFIGTTDEIIQWAACKWGLSADMLRAQAAQESTWRQSAAGNLERRSDGNCAPEDADDPCPTSFGLLQNKWYFNRGAYPMLRTMTSFHMDWSAAKLRGCYEGSKGFPRGDIWACVGEWFSGAWNDAGAVGYIARVKAQLDDRRWSGWEDGSATVPYRTELVE